MSAFGKEPHHYRYPYRELSQLRFVIWSVSLEIVQLVPIFDLILRIELRLYSLLSMNHSSFLQGPSSHETCLASPRQMVNWAPGKCQRRLIIRMSARLDSQVWLKYCAGVGAGS